MKLERLRRNKDHNWEICLDNIWIKIQQVHLRLLVNKLTEDS